jgi:hypothetical protein
MSTHHFTDTEGNEHWPVEVFYHGDHAPHHDGTPAVDDEPAMEAGWYWWTCFPGCMPESDPHGPFDCEDDAITDAEYWLNDG